MTRQVINVGTGPNTGNGDAARDAFVKVNANFLEVYQQLGQEVAEDINNFSSIVIAGQGTVEATQPDSTLTIIAGANILLVTDPVAGSVSIAATGDVGYVTMQEEGAGLAAQSTLNFIGAGFTASNDAPNSRTNLTLAAELNALSQLAATGLFARTAPQSYASRAITAGSTKVTVANGNGIAGNPVIDIDESFLSIANIGGTLPVNRGGTGATDAAAARTNLQITGQNLAGIVPVTAGGTEANTAPQARINLGLSDAALNIVFNGFGAVLTTGVKADIVVPYNCTITGWWLLADVSGSIVIDIWKQSYASYPPLVAQTITGTEKPTITAAIKAQDTSLTTWTTALVKGDILRFNIDSVSTIGRVTLYLSATR